MSRRIPIAIPFVLGLLVSFCANQAIGRVSEEPTVTPSRPAATPATSQPAASTSVPRPTGTNPFGVMLPSQLVRSFQGMRVAKVLGAVYFRPASIFWLLSRICADP